MRGFTLIEMLVALAVFAIIGLMSNQLLRQIIDIGEHTGNRGARLVETQRAMEIIRRDIQQLAHRGVRDELGDPQPGFEINELGLLQFTRRGWANPLQRNRSELQRVAYAMVEGTLVRLYWPALDRARDSLPIRQLLLQDVGEIEVLAVDLAGVEHRFWPPDDQAGGQPHTLAAVVLRMTLAPYGNVERIWTVPMTTGPLAPSPSDIEINSSI